MDKYYKIVNNFRDIHTGERYTKSCEPIPFSEERIKEINKVETLIGCKLVEEIDVSKIIANLEAPITDNENSTENTSNEADTIELTENTDLEAPITDNEEDKVKKNKKK